MRPWLISVAALGLALALSPVARQSAQAQTASPPTPSLLLPRAQNVAGLPLDAASPTQLALPPVLGLDLLHIGMDDVGASAPAADGSVAKLTLDPDLQAAAWAILSVYHLPEAAIVAMDTET